VVADDSARPRRRDCVPLPQVASSSLQATTVPPTPGQPFQTSRTVSMVVALHRLMSQFDEQLGWKENQTSLSTAVLQAVPGPSTVAAELLPFTPPAPVPLDAMTAAAEQLSFAGGPPIVTDAV